MATYVTAQTFEGGPSAEEIQEMMVAKAHELFKACDKEEKGFICKRDMQRLQAELPLSPEQLEDVFDSLDDDNNGFLTLEEFTEGFGKLLVNLLDNEYFMKVKLICLGHLFYFLFTKPTDPSL